jgi:PKD repeat protein
MRNHFLLAVFFVSINFLSAQNPVITNLIPSNFCEGEVITINGLSFDPFCIGGNNNNRRVTINGVNITSFLSWTDNQIKLVVPLNVTNSLFTGGVTVRNKCSNAGSGGLTTIYNQPPPLSSITAIKTNIECGETTTIFISGTTSFNTWYTGSCGGTEISNSIVSLDVSPTTTTTYYVANGYVGPGDCMSECLSITINVIPCNSIPPYIVSQSNNQTLCEGESIQLSVSAEGTPPPTYQWRFNGANIFGATSSTYNINPTNSSHTGVYDVVITNTAGSVVSNPINVTVISAPPVATFDFQINDNSLVNFTNNTQNATSFLWNFGDGNTSIEANPIHNFAQQGSYEVTLIAQNICGADTFKTTLNIQGVNIINLDKDGIKLYPQPSNNLTFIEIPELINNQLSLLMLNDLSGRIVYSKSISNIKESIYALNLESIENGIYILSVVFNNRIYQRPLIKADN